MAKSKDKKTIERLTDERNHWRTKANEYKSQPDIRHNGKLATKAHKEALNNAFIDGTRTGTFTTIKLLAPMYEAQSEFQLSVRDIHNTVQNKPYYPLNNFKEILEGQRQAMTVVGQKLHYLCIKDGNNWVFATYADYIKGLMSQLNDAIDKVHKNKDKGESLIAFFSEFDVNRITTEVAKTYQKSGWQGIQKERAVVGQRAYELQQLKAYKTPAKGKHIRTGHKILEEFSSSTATTEQEHAHGWLVFWENNNRRLGQEISRAIADHKSSLLRIPNS
jgi:hypothetical protein